MNDTFSNLSSCLKGIFRSELGEYKAISANRGEIDLYSSKCTLFASTLVYVNGAR